MKDLSRDILSAYVDNEVEGKPLKILEKHVEHCERCKNTVEFFSTIKECSKSSRLDFNVDQSAVRVKNLVSSLNLEPTRKVVLQKRYFFKIAISVFVLIIFSFIFIIVSGRIVTKNSASRLASNIENESIKDEEVKSITPDYSKIKSVDY